MPSALHPEFNREGAAVPTAVQAEFGIVYATVHESGGAEQGGTVERGGLAEAGVAGGSRGVEIGNQFTAIDSADEFHGRVASARFG